MLHLRLLLGAVLLAGSDYLRLMIFLLFLEDFVQFIADVDFIFFIVLIIDDLLLGFNVIILGVEVESTLLRL